MLKQGRFIKAVVRNNDYFENDEKSESKVITTGDGRFTVIFKKEQELPEKVYNNLINAVGTAYNTNVGRRELIPKEFERFIVSKNGDWICYIDGNEVSQDEYDMRDMSSPDIPDNTEQADATT